MERYDLSDLLTPWQAMTYAFIIPPECLIRILFPQHLQLINNV